MADGRLARLASPNRRDFFRLDVHETDCLFTVTSIAGQPPEGDAAEPRTYEVLDLGGGGIAFRSRSDDWPIREGVVGSVQFRVADHEYDFRCRLVRKVDALDTFDYGGRWAGVPPPQVDDLVYTLYQMEVARSAARPGHRGLPAGRGGGGRQGSGTGGRRPVAAGRAGGWTGPRTGSRDGEPADGGSPADTGNGSRSGRVRRRQAVWAAVGLTLGMGLLALPDAPYRDPLAAALWVATVLVCLLL